MGFRPAMRTTFSLLLLSLASALASDAQTYSLPQGLPAVGYPNWPVISDIPARNYYLGTFKGGLYGDWQNGPPASQLARLETAAGNIQPLNTSGSPCSGAGCNILVLDIGHSRTARLISTSAGIYSTQAGASFVGSFLNYMGFNPANPLTPPPNLNSAMVWFDYAVESQETNRWIDDGAGEYTAGFNHNMVPIWQGQIAADSSGTKPGTWYQRYHCGEEIAESGHIQKITATNSGDSCVAQSPIFDCTPGASAPTWNNSGGNTTSGTCTFTDQGTGTLASYSNSQVQVTYVRTIPVIVQEFAVPSCSGTVSGGTTLTFTLASCNWTHGANYGMENMPAIIGGTNVTIQTAIVSGANAVITFTPSISNGAASMTTPDFSGSLQKCPSGIWVTPNCEYNLYTWHLGQLLRWQKQTEFPNLQLSVISADIYSGYLSTTTTGCTFVASCLRQEPDEAEDWFAIQHIVHAQISQDNSACSVFVVQSDGSLACQTFLTFTYSRSGTTVTATVATGSLTALFVNGATAQIAGAADATFDTPCTEALCNGAVISNVTGTSFQYTTATSGTASTSGGHASIIYDPVILGGLESLDGTAAVLAVGPYQWGDITPRSDGFEFPTQAYQGDCAHESFHSQSPTCAAAHGSDSTWGTNNNSGQDYLSKQEISFWTGCTTQDGASGAQNLGNTPYAFGPTLPFMKWMLASGHQTACGI
jgi:hypothetical protein